MRLGPVSTSAEVAHREWLLTGSVNYPTDSTIWGEAHNVATNNKPALATRFGSSKVTPIRSIRRDTGITESAS